MEKEKTFLIALRISPKLDGRLLKRAKIFGIKNRSEAVRQAIRAYVEDDQSPADPEKTEEFLALAGEVVALRKAMTQIGGNLNQIARKFNETGKLYPGELYINQNELREEFKELRKLLGRTLAARTK